MSRELVLDQRSLGRTLLARQLLLERWNASITEAIEQVGGPQSRYARARRRPGGGHLVVGALVSATDQFRAAATAGP